eukprot:SAG31_NODE_24587_length_478_cov_1.068602_1_plen_88_part_10
MKVQQQQCGAAASAIAARWGVALLTEDGQGTVVVRDFERTARGLPARTAADAPPAAAPAARAAVSAARIRGCPAQQRCAGLSIRIQHT